MLENNVQILVNEANNLILRLTITYIFETEHFA